MPISFVGAGALASDATTGPISPAFPTGTAVDDLIFCHAYSYVAGTIATPAGWTLLRQASVAGGGTAAVFSRVGVAGDTAPSISGAGSGIYAACSVYRGVDTTTPIDSAVPAASTGSSTAVSAPSVTTATGDAWAVWFHAQGDNNELGSPTNSATLRYGGLSYSAVAGSDACMGSASKLITPSGASGTCALTATGGQVNTQWVGIAVALRPAATTINVTVPGISSAETFGAATVTTGPVSVSPTGIPSGEAFGTATLRVTVTPTGIASAETFGTPTVNVVGIITPAGIPSGEAFGTPGISPQHVSPSGVGSGEAFGTPSLTLTVTAAGIASEETFGSPTVSMIVYPSAIPTGETFGVATVSPGPVAVSPTGIGSGELFGEPDVFITLDPTERIRPVRVRVVPLYEVVVVGRVPASFGPPTFDQVDPLDWSKITWSSTLSRPQRLSVTCKTSTITEPIAQRLRNPDRLPTELWVSRNGRRVFAGPLLGGARNGDELTLECGGLLTYLQWMIVNADLRFDQVDQFTITTALIDQWQNLEFGHFGIDTTTVGTSGVLRDRSYVRNEIHQVARRVEELGAVRDGFDSEIDPTTRKLQLWYPGKGVDRSGGDDAIVFDGRNIDDQNAMFSIGPADLASHAFGSGSRSGGDSTLWSEQFNADLRAAFGRAAFTAAFSDVELQGTLDDHVGGLLDARDQPLRAPGQKVRVPVDADLDAYDVGDTVTYELDDLLGIGGAWRIRSRTVNVETTGSEAVDLEFV